MSGTRPEVPDTEEELLTFSFCFLTSSYRTVDVEGGGGKVLAIMYDIFVLYETSLFLFERKRRERGEKVGGEYL